MKKGDITPFVSIIIPAYNEEKDIEKKIANTLALGYPKDKVEILIGSDGSEDRTNEILHRIRGSGIRTFIFNQNRGKTAVQNDLVGSARGDILIFTDAASFLPSNASYKIIRNFADDQVGCVAGRLQFVSTDKNLTTQSQGLYWTYELKIRKMESTLGNLIGVDGPLYAVRRDCYIPLDHNLISDLITPLLILEKGKRVVIEPEAFVYEAPTLKFRQEFNTRRRITLRGLIGISSHLRLLNPFRNPVLAFQIFFHKVLRWFVGPLIVINLFACIGLSMNPLFKWILLGYIAFFCSAGLGWLLERNGLKARVLRIPYYFSLVNFAATTAIIDFFRKKQAISWQPTRQ